MALEIKDTGRWKMCNICKQNPGDTVWDTLYKKHMGQYYFVSGEILHQMVTQHIIKILYHTKINLKLY